MPGKTYHVYILTNRSGTLYIGMTSELEGRLAQHRAGVYPQAFSKRYAMNRLIYIETFGEARDAVQRERQLKGWRREKKVALINATNPDWHDLAPP
ncbi:MAG: GIY-YIG nuclease family protein [Bacteroidota bacterium]